MEPLNCCKGCNGLNEDGTFRNKLKCLVACDKYALEHAKRLYDEQKGNKGCSTCKHCEHIQHFPANVTAEESICRAGLECNTVLFSVKDCPKWVGKFESEE
jgi:hypothetical protein